MLWIALQFISGGIAVIGKKKKLSAK